MRFFTRAWTEGELDDDETDRLPNRYLQHLYRVLPSLPSSVQAFVRDVNLHDGLIQATMVNREACQLRIRVCCGDLQVGYYDVDLIYEGVDVDNLNISVLRAAVEAADTEVLYDEVDATHNGHAVHRLLFWPRHELEIVFDGLRFTKTARADRAAPVGAGLREIPRRSG